MESLREDGFRRILRVDCLVATGMFSRAHVAFAGHSLAAGHLRLGHLAQVGGAGDGWQQRPGKQDGGSKPTAEILVTRLGYTRRTSSIKLVIFLV